jgi:hypothetical protein
MKIKIETIPFIPAAFLTSVGILLGWIIEKLS